MKHLTFSYFSRRSYPERLTVSDLVCQMTCLCVCAVCVYVRGEHKKHQVTTGQLNASCIEQPDMRALEL